ncbi:MAG TPA: tyrosine-type recombinase/integrase [Thermoplasmata archaeon]|nr:tyrosine-type recombinase/integrase [Thermoplasmata archaeon]
MSTNGEIYRTGRDALTEDEVREVLRFTSSLRDHILLRLAVTTGIRREDLIGIERSGVNLETGEIQFYEAKKRRQHLVRVSGETLEWLRRYANSLLGDSRYLFPSSHRGVKHLDGKTAWNVLQRALRLAGLHPRPFHALRATCVKLAQRRGWSPEQVSELTGDTIRVIQQHYATPSHDEMTEVVREKPLL